MTVADVDLFEVNEAFAHMCVSTSRILDIPHEIMNVNGSVVLAHHGGVHRRPHGGHHAPRARPPRRWHRVVSMCAGGGMGSATVLEVEPA